MSMIDHIQGLIDIAKFSLNFAKVNRVTMHEDGERYESDTDHTVMLAICACSLADSLYKNKLDIGKVAQFAIVHDLVEAYAGDTNTININDKSKEEKEKKEFEALKRIKNELGNTYPWIHKTIEDYESLDTKEAIFIKILDKSMTKITNTLNHGLALKKIGKTKDDIEKHFAEQAESLKYKYGKDFPELILITEGLMSNMIKEIYV